MLNEFAKYIVGGDSSLQTKARQHREPATCTGLFSSSYERPKHNLLKVVDLVCTARNLTAEGRTPKHAGSVGHIYTAIGPDSVRWAVKVPNTKSVSTGASALRQMGMFAAFVNKAAGASMSSLADSMEKEADMETEAAMATIVGDAIAREPSFSDMFTVPIVECCHGACVYPYITGVTVDQVAAETRDTIMINLLRLQYWLLENKGILLGDLNVGNVLWDGETQRVWLIDHGAVRTLDKKQQQFVAEMRAARCAKRIAEWLGSVGAIDSVGLQAAVTAELLIDGKAKSFSAMPALDLANCSKNKLPPELALIIRAQLHLIQSLRSLGVYMSEADAKQLQTAMLSGWGDY